MNSSFDPFQSTKHHILKQKYEYMTHYLAETEGRLAELKNSNRRLRTRFEQLKECANSPRAQQEEYEAFMRICREEEREKTRRIDELKRLIAEYKYLCQEAAKNKAPQPQTARTRPRMAAQEARQNSFFSAMGCSENENLNNVSSVSRNKSYQKVKTKLHCHNCEAEFKPNEYYRHLEYCRPTQSNPSHSYLRLPDSTGCRTMRN